MKRIAFIAVVGACAALFACSSPPGTAEDFKWSVECPKSVDKGAEFVILVRTLSQADQPVEGVKFRYQIMWPGGSAQPLRHKGRSGDTEKVHARLAPGTATIVFTCENRQGVDVKVLETTFEVK